MSGNKVQEINEKINGFALLRFASIRFGSVWFGGKGKGTLLQLKS